MKLVTYTRGGQTLPGILSEDEMRVASLSAILGRPIPALLAFVQQHTPEDIARLEQAARGQGGHWLPLSGVALEAPIRRPIHDILCVGVNYAAHLQEAQQGLDPAMTAPPKETVYFSKRACRITGPGEVIESHQSLDASLDYEVELAVIIGKTGRDIPREQVEDYIFGYSIFNDISARRLQRRHLQWYRGKSLDGFSVMGPAIIHKGALPFPLELDIRSYVNDELRQDSNTRLLIADIPAIVSQFSQGMTLEAGDIIATGTPSGVGMGFDPPRFMRPGDKVRCEIESIGTLTNTIGE